MLDEVEKMHSIPCIRKTRSRRHTQFWNFDVFYFWWHSPI